MDRGRRGSAGSQQVGFAGGLERVQKHICLREVRRAQHPDTSHSTHVARTGSDGYTARLDRWLLSDTLVPLMGAADVQVGLPGDHLGVSVNLRVPGQVCRGPGTWRFPLNLLHDPTFTGALTEALATFLETHPITAQLTHGSRWEYL